MILSVNSDYFLKQGQPVDLCNGEELCFLCGTDWIIKYYVDELRLQGVKHDAMKMYGSLQVQRHAYLTPTTNEFG
jgi:hypothetical protein